MAESGGEKSFDATPHRRQEAREKGQVAFSQDLGSAAMLMVAAFLLMTMGGAVIAFCAQLMRHQLGEVPDLRTSQETLLSEWVRVTLPLGWLLLPILGYLMLGGILSSVLQVGLMWLPERL